MDVEIVQHIDTSRPNDLHHYGDKESVASELIYCSSEYGGEEDADQRRFSEVGSESGVEPDYSEWVFDENMPEVEAMFELTNEQALATLKYFSSTANRTNMMTKTHGTDLDLISQLLLEKEKDLGMAAKIGQSLLQRNKSLLVKIEEMEEYLTTTKDSEMQLKHDLQHKNEMARLYFEDDEQNSFYSDGSRECDDAEILSLTNRCRSLEKENQELFSEALNIRQMTNDVESKEEDLVLDCIEQLASAKHQITTLTDEIAQKFEDNVQQQEEITQLIDVVVELQKKQKQLSTDNEELQMQLMEAHSHKESLSDQLSEMQVKFREAYEMLQENQEEMKALRSRVDMSNGNSTEWSNDSGNTISIQDSLANEIEESVRRNLIYAQECKKQNKKLLDNVRWLNVKTSGSATSLSSGRTSPLSNWSLASDERSDTLSGISTMDCEKNRPKKNVKKLQIVKPMEGSDTLNKWHHLASKNVKGFNVSEGLDVSEGPNVSDEIKYTVLHDDDRSTVVHDEKLSPNSAQSISPISTPTSTNTQEPKRAGPKIRKSIRPNTASTPNAKIGTSMLSELETPAETKRTIITRNSSALNSLRQGRKLLRNKETKSKAEVIDMIASAMNKANIEAQAGQRILTSLSTSTKQRKRSDSLREKAESYSKSPDFREMPNFSKVLEKVAQNPNTIPRPEISSDDLESEVDESPPVMADLNSISGPLGLLSRVDPAKPNENLLSRLLRYSSIDTNAPPLKPVENKHLASVASQGNSEGENMPIRRNKSSGSLVEMMMSNKLQGSLRPLGVSGIINNVSSEQLEQKTSSVGLLSVVDNTKMQHMSEQSNTAAQKETSKSVETGLDDVRKTENTKSGGGGLSFLSSIFGNFS